MDDERTQDGGAASARLDGLNVAVVGAGRIGIELIRNLGLMGVGRIDVYESDRMRADRLRNRYQVHDGDFWDLLTLARLQAYDYAVCTIESVAARVRLNRKCLIANVNLVHAWTEGSRAIVGVYPFRALPECACAECRPLEGEEPLPLATVRLAVADAPSTEVTTASVAGALAAALIARVAAGAHGTVARRATLDAMLGQGTSLEVRRNPDCARCRAIERPVPIVQTRNRWAVSAPVAASSPGTLEQSLQLSDDLEGLPGHTFSVGELVERYAGGPIPAKFALTVLDGRTICLDFEDAPAAAAELPRGRASRHAT